VVENICDRESTNQYSPCYSYPSCGSIYFLALMTIFSFPIYGYGQTETSLNSSTEESVIVVEYPAAFFALYQPGSALDMVRQVPGFQLDDGGSNRGFAGAAGNVLINGRRPSAKQDLPSAILSRIPASQVERIELIRGQLRGIDLRGQSMAVNVFLSQDIPASIRWEIFLQHNTTAPIKPAANISLSDTWKNIDFNAGLDVERNTSGYNGIESESDTNGMLTHQGPEYSTETGYKINALSLTASSWLGETFVQVNTRFGMDDSNYKRPSTSVNLMTGVVQEALITTKNLNKRFELGFDLERSLNNDLVAKAIILFINGDRDSLSSRLNSDTLRGQTLFRVADTKTITSEGISRLEFNWTGIQDHSIQFNLEGAYNSVDGSLMQTDDRGSGPVLVGIPGANTQVEELRGDFLLKDTWVMGYVELDYGLAAEVSTLKQSGDEEQKRSFTFLKPMGSLAYSIGQGQQIRLLAEKRVSQLNFNDFISAAVFQDDNLALGNPNLQPDTTWVTELSYERRFGRVGVAKVTGFHHWITDVLDLLPLTDIDAVPGNIGDGRRWGLVFEGTMPLDWLGLIDSRMRFTARWTESTVVDPVTGVKRILSGQSGLGGYRTLTTRNQNNKYFLGLSYRQDFAVARVAWGWEIAERAERPLFKVNELDVYNEGFAIDTFVETTRWFGVKSRISVENILDVMQTRNRTIFTGKRDLSPLENSLLTKRLMGRRISLSITGSF